MDLNAKLLRDSFYIVSDDAEEMIASFYKILLMRHPELRPLFDKIDMDAQRKMLIESLVLIVKSLDQPDQLATTLKDLGQRHTGYGVKPEYYPYFGKCLVEAMAKTAGDQWTPQLTILWSDAFNDLTSVMVQGAEELG